MDITISTGKSRTARTWRNITITWRELTDLLAHTKRTSETVSEYHAMSKDDQAQVKDVGGFVGGHLTDGHRKAGHVHHRSLLTLDIDQAEPGLWVAFTLLYDGTAAVLYSTHSHTPDNARLRLIIPLSRPVSEDEYPAVARKVADRLGIRQFDPTTYQAARLMYWPSTPSDGEYVYEHQDGASLDPDMILAEYSDWRDMSQWPTHPDEAAPRASHAKKEDPTLKPGIVGAFSRAYTIDAAIEKFLPDVYEPAGPNRYTYKPGETTGGVVVYDHSTRAYSHHATDPAGGQALNAFDLVRIHKYADQDTNVEAGTPITDYPSYQAMARLAVDDEETKKQLTADRLREASEEFTEITTPDETPDWYSRLQFTEKGAIKTTVNNFLTILGNTDAFKSIAYNEMTGTIEARDPKALPWEQLGETWSDADEAQLRVYIQRAYTIDSPGQLHDALTVLATNRAWHPIRDYLNHLPDWDELPRVDTLLIDYLGAEDTVYTREATRKTLAAAVARIHAPGIKFDNVLILNGPQGIGKSYLFNRLAGDWFSDNLTLSDMRDKTAAEKVKEAWILELGELAGMRKMDAETIKSFITRTHDKYRPAYGRNVETHARACIIVGTTNDEDGFLRDVTGNRRFWPVSVTGNTTVKPWHITDETRDQIWAEALHYYSQGEELYLKGETLELAEAAQAGALETDDREGIVRAYLDTLLPSDWDTRTLVERRGWLDDSDEFDKEQPGTSLRGQVSGIEIWCECFGRAKADFTRREAYQIANIMSRIEGWERATGTSRPYLPIYGRQRVWIRSQK
ncbi:MAG: virulence-associated E family protein [Actinomycetaceae bacterium]|nr:virulence-associated E family protein [Actinomycetaceae bacterium]